MNISDLARDDFQNIVSQDYTDRIIILNEPNSKLIPCLIWNDEKIDDKSFNNISRPALMLKVNYSLKDYPHELSKQTKIFTTDNKKFNVESKIRDETIGIVNLILIEDVKEDVAPYKGVKNLGTD